MEIWLKTLLTLYGPLYTEQFATGISALSRGIKHQFSKANTKDFQLHGNECAVDISSSREIVAFLLSCVRYSIIIRSMF